ncbi:CHAD domain-containing protein [Pseudoponticoccus marisrubri]|uniref:CHAD domain-containing protein n=1 Tax=Pseudoponticoccus marisrubri TaxID=1685382 RepID=A0A0W7WDZ9_9RHOB|nr:CHAD domain-containing protein [Pseudoponticoccus marisrubri]KUF08867.1 hypothetical protein AVJ23_20480 [Pseudoponticoccus marisrubri]
MTSTSPIPLLFAGDLLPRLDALASDKRRVICEDAAPDSRFALIDTFDGAISAAGMLLLSDGESWHLLQPAGPALRQHATEPGFPDALPEGPVTEALRPVLSPLRRLLVQGTGTAAHHGLRLVDDLDKTLVRGELWRLEAEDRVASLLLLRPLRGYDKALDRLRGDLDRLEALSATDAAGLRGRLGAEAVPYTSKPEIGMAPDETAFRAACDIIATHLAVARRNEPGTIADLDTEFLHDYRVALRRVRSVVSLFKGVFSEDQTQELKDRFGALMAETGRLRDLDVYLIERDTYLELVPDAMRPGLERLFDMFAEERDAEQARLAEHLQSEAYAKEIRKLQKLFDKPKKLERGPKAARSALEFARKLIWARYRKVCAKAAQIDAGTPDAVVHELRIHCKKLRYLMEFFAPLFGKAEMKPLIKALKRLQDNLGLFNDYSVQQAELGAALDRLGALKPAQRLEIATSLGALLTVLDQRQRAERARVVDSFARFDSPATRAGFAALFHGKGGKR